MLAGVIQLMSVNGVMVPPLVHPVTLIAAAWNGTWKQDSTAGLLTFDPTTVTKEPAVAAWLHPPP